MDSSIAFFMGRGRFKRSHCYRVYCTPAEKIFMHLLPRQQKPDTPSGSGFNLPSFLLRSCAMLSPLFPFGSALKNAGAQAAGKHCR